MLRAAFGRTTEVTEMSWDEVRWDPHGQVATVSIVELKTSKTKSFALPAGKTCLDCVYVKAGDWFATSHEARGVYDAKSQDARVFPSLSSKRFPGVPTSCTMRIHTLEQPAITLTLSSNPTISSQLCIP
jgi:hypothetical protein